MALLVAAALLVYACGKPERASRAQAKARFDSTKAAAHIANVVFGPIWPHDSVCYVWAQAEVAAGRMRASDDDDAFAHCTDTAELEARKHPLTPKRRAMMEARRTMGLSALPRTSYDSNPSR